MAGERVVLLLKEVEVGAVEEVGVLEQVEVQVEEVHWQEQESGVEPGVQEPVSLSPAAPVSSCVLTPQCSGRWVEVEEDTHLHLSDRSTCPAHVS